MRWEGRERSQNVEDRRGARPVGKALGGGGLLTIVIALMQLSKRQDEFASPEVHFDPNAIFEVLRWSRCGTSLDRRNSPPYTAPYNGAIEHSQGELKNWLRKWNTVADTLKEFELQVENAAHALNHRPRRSLCGKNSCRPEVCNF